VTVFLAGAAALAALLPGQLERAGELKRGREMYMEIRREAQAAVQDDTRSIEDGMTGVLDTAMKSINKDYTGWIEIPGTGISYPMVQTDNNDEYLKKDFEGRDYAGGSIFLDCRCAGDLEEKNTMIYGHCMRDGSMFTDLRRFLDRDFLRNTGTVLITKGGYRYVYRIFSAFVAKPEEDCFRVEFSSDYDYGKWLERQKDRSQVETAVYPDRSDRIITMVTCHADGSRRCVVQAVLTGTEEAD